MVFPDVPDFRTVIAQFEALTADWERTASQLAEAAAASGGTETTAEFTLRVATGGRIAELTFTDRARAASPVQLRESVLDALARLTVAGNRQLAADVARILGDPDLATGIRSAVPQEIADRVPEDGDATPVPSPAPAGSARVYPASADEVLEWAAATADEPVIVSPDVAELMSDVEGWNPGYLGRFDPLTTQFELERELAQISAQAVGLSSTLEKLTATASDHAVTVTVNGVGRLVDLVFRPGLRSTTGTALTTQFAHLYAQATSEASTLALAQLDATGLAGADDPSRGLIATVRTEARQHLDAEDPS